MGPFDTVNEYMAYCTSQDEFDQQFEYVKERLDYYNKLYDQYHNYDHMNNIKTINDNAGKKKIKVEQPIIDLLELSIQRNKEICSKVNIAFGSVIEIWHQYRENADNGVGEVPSLKNLKKAAKHTQIESIHLDKKNKTVYIDDKDVNIDVGAVAKGYAIELIKDELIKKEIDHFLISGGGNVITHGMRQVKKSGEVYLDDCKDHFCVGIQSPKDGNFDNSDNEYQAILVSNNQAVVTSGDYQRYYVDKNGVRYHHIIDPDTLYPANYFRSVSVICEDSGLADFMSTALFLLDYKEGLKLVESMKDVEAIWLLNDGKIRMSSHLKDNDQVYIMEKERLK